jgi:Phycobilisome protein
MVSVITRESIMTSNLLSPEILDLIKKARIVSFATWRDSHPPELLALFQSADDRRLYLTDEELELIAKLRPERTADLFVVAMLRDEVVEIVNEARSEVLVAFPEILLPGGGLYPAERADACWRDFWHFLRCITYGIAGQRPEYLSAEGLHYLNLLYRELQVPLVAMLVGLEGIKQASLKRMDFDVPIAKGASEAIAKGASEAIEELSQRQQSLGIYFDELIAQLKQFSPG